MKVNVSEERIIIPTYGTGNPDKNPMFLEKRVYQGSSGKVYPLPVIESISDEKKDTAYDVVFLENEYLKVMIMPSLGGRVQMLYDKKHDYHAVYYNSVIKPALVGLAGPWISGGIEFNWPQHHRPSTFDEVDHSIEEHADGSKTVWVSEVELMSRTKGMAGFTLHPDSAYLEVRAKVYNPTDQPKTFLWWANPALAVGDSYQSVFPPDVHAVMDHGKRDVSRFPIATGTYYKMDYSAGVDISRYSNLKVPTSYMAHHSEYDFVGGYDHRRQSGMLHVADHHIVPGKKQWVWGSGDFGQAWDRNLTDSDGPYAELMTGAFTDNQPDFTWLQPYEEKQFTQYFMPYYDIGYVRDASKDLMLSLDIDEQFIRPALYASSPTAELTLVVTAKDHQLFSKTLTLKAEGSWSEELQRPAAMPEHEIGFSVFSGEELLLSYQQEAPRIHTMPPSAEAAAAPEDIPGAEELFLTGLHIEQYRHATRDAEDYYREALKRDPGDSRCANALGRIMLRRGDFTQAEQLFSRAVKRLTMRNPNPYDGEPHYNLALSQLYQEDLASAYGNFYKAAWTEGRKSAAFFQLACLDCRKDDLKTAEEHLASSLAVNRLNHAAAALMITILRKTGRTEQALSQAETLIFKDQGDWYARYERYLLTGEHSDLESFLSLMRDCDNNHLELSLQYRRSGCTKEAAAVLELLIDRKGLEKVSPLIAYHAAEYSETAESWERAAALCPDGCFPSKLESLQVLRKALRVLPEDAHAHYFLGNLHYDLRNYETAMGHWQRCIEIFPQFPTAHRNLALALMNKQGDNDGCREHLETAFELDNSDARVLYELDQFYRATQRAPQERLSFLTAHMETVKQRDDLYLEYCSLLNVTGREQEALEAILKRTFHPWEGGEGKVPAQYLHALLSLAAEALQQDDAPQALSYLERCRVYPDSLGEGRLHGAQENDIDYLTGLAYQSLSDDAAARRYFEQAAGGDISPASAMYYNDQQPHMLFFQGLACSALGSSDKAQGVFNRLISYGEDHIDDHMIIDYFAVSLPDFLVFEQDLDRKNRLHCQFMLYLGYLGAGRNERTRQLRSEILTSDAMHILPLVERISRVHKVSS